MTQDI